MGEANTMEESRSLIEFGIDKGYLKIYEKNGISQIEYIKAKKERTFDGPEEKVRAEVYVELIEKYGYPPEKISLDDYPPVREGGRPADIVIYDRNDFPFIVVEVKRRNATDEEILTGLRELFGNANLFGVRWALFDCRSKRQAYFSLTNFSLTKEADLRRPDIPRAYLPLQKFLYGNKVGFPLTSFDEISEFQRTIKRCHDILRDNEGLSPLQAFPVISRIIFAKIYDELHTPEGQYHQFQIGVEEDEINVASRITMRYKEASALEPEMFSPYLGIENTQTLFEIVRTLQKYALYKTPYDVKGEAYQAFLSKLMRGETGQYFTPRQVVKPTVEILAPTETEKIIDPCCGTGGFLIYTFKYLRDKIMTEYIDDKIRTRKEYDVAHYNIFGIEIDRNVAEACIVGMLLEDDAHGNVAVTDALSSWDDPVFLKKGIRPEGFSVLLTNPPFGKKGRLKEYKDRFQLAKEFETPSFETLVLERGIELLSPSGRLGIVIPDVNLTQKGVLNFLWKNAIVLGVVSLPSETFNPYGSGAKTSVLFLRKKRTNDEETKKIFMASVYQIGYDSTGRRKGDGKNYFEDIVGYFHKFLSEEKVASIANDKFAIFVLEGDQLRFARENLKFDNYISYGNLKWKECLKYVRLGEVADVFRGYTPGWHEYADSGVPILKVRNLTNKYVDFNFERRGHVPEEIYTKHPEAHIRQFDILLTASAHKQEYIAKKVDIVDILPNEKCMCVAELLILRPKKSIDPFYLLAVLRKKYINEQIRGCIRGTTAHIYPGDVKEKVNVPRISPEREGEIGKSLKDAIQKYREFEIKFSEHKKILNNELD